MFSDTAEMLSPVSRSSERDANTLATEQPTLAVKEFEATEIPRESDEARDGPESGVESEKPVAVEDPSTLKEEIEASILTRTMTPTNPEVSVSAKSVLGKLKGIRSRIRGMKNSTKSVEDILATDSVFSVDDVKVEQVTTIPSMLSSTGTMTPSAEALEEHCASPAMVQPRGELKVAPVADIKPVAEGENEDATEAPSTAPSMLEDVISTVSSAIFSKEAPLTGTKEEPVPEDQKGGEKVREVIAVETADDLSLASGTKSVKLTTVTSNVAEEVASNHSVTPQASGRTSKTNLFAYDGVDEEEEEDEEAQTKKDATKEVAIADKLSNEEVVVAKEDSKPSSTMDVNSSGKQEAAASFDTEEDIALPEGSSDAKLLVSALRSMREAVDTIKSQEAIDEDNRATNENDAVNEKVASPKTVTIKEDVDTTTNRPFFSLRSKQTKKKYKIREYENNIKTLSSMDDASVKTSRSLRSVLRRKKEKKAVGEEAAAKAASSVAVE